MAAVSALTRQSLTAISGLVQANLVREASTQLTALIRALSPQELVLVSHDIRHLADGFQKQRRRDLLAELNRRLENVAPDSQTGDGRTVRSQVSAVATDHLLSIRTSAMLQELANNHIFKWAPNYRDVLRFIVDSAMNELSDLGANEAELAAISEQFAAHSKEIFGRGYAFQSRRGLTSNVAEIKSISGLQAFLDLAVSVYLERRQSVASASEAGILWGITSAMLAGITGGYGAVDFGGVAGWLLIAKNPRSWVPPMGFCRGAELMTFFEEFPSSHRDEDLFRALVGT
jgi:hypothetical protein